MKAKKVICISVISVLLFIVMAVDIACGMFSRYIDSFLSPVRVDSAVRAEGKLLAFDIEREGIVLTKNDNNVLPLTHSDTRVNVFGWAATQWIRSGDGSGRSGTSRDSIQYDLLESFSYRKMHYNENLISCYRNFRSEDRQYTNSLSSTNAQFSRLYEPSIKDTGIFSTSTLLEAKNYSDVALVILGRVSGESNDCPKTQYKQTKKGNGDSVDATDDTRTYLDISTEEEELLTYVGANYEKVVVIINSSNVMNLEFMERIDGLDSCLIVGGTGAYGALAILNVLYGIDSPSGRTADTYAYDFKSSPSYATSGGEGLGAYTNANGLYPTTKKYGSDGQKKNFPQVSYADYVEDIYVGYKWYETADAEGYFNGVSNQYGNGYDGVVQYPFGYGLSYTTFEKQILSVSPEKSNWTKADAGEEISVKVRVQNTGTVAGREVVQLYYTPPYYSGKIEKSHRNLLAFAKTTMPVQPGDYEDLTLTFCPADLASYDCYDKNGNGFKGYELEHGKYTIELMKNSHERENVKSGKATVDFNVQTDVCLDTDVVSGNKVVNRFTGSAAVDGISLDGTTDGVRNSSTGEGITYLTRSDFAGTFPTQKRPDRAIRSDVRALNTYTDERMSHDLEDEKDEVVTFGKKNGKTVYANGAITDLGRTLGTDYDSELWQDVLDQIPYSEMETLVLHGYMGTRALSSIGVPELKASDGPAHLGSWGSVVKDPDENTTPFPQPTVLAQTWNKETAYSFGLAMGNEARAAGLDSWYGPGINLHRHPFGGRNYEYYSEDPVLSGYMCAQSFKGAKQMGVYGMIKHLALYNTDTLRDGQYVWLTEQNLRETYLKSFRIAIQQGEATGLMSSYNRIGAVWTGASTALQQKVIRDEFGFKGLIITDYSDHKNAKDCMMIGDAILRNGGDLWMDGYLSDGRLLYETSSNRFRQALRKAVKNIVYTYLNAQTTHEEYVANGGDKGIVAERGSQSVVWWKYLLGGVNVLAVGGCGVWLFFVLRKPKIVSATS